MEGRAMKKTTVLAAVSIFSLAASTGAVATGGGEGRGAPAPQVRAISFELVGQFQNSGPGVTPPTHSHYGYLSYAGGLLAFTGATQNETTALFTFYADATTPRVIPDGPLRVVTRLGRLTVYRDTSPDGNFARPDSFRDGTPVLVARFRQQVVTDTVTESLTTFHLNTILSTKRFRSGRRDVQLGRPNGRFRIVFNGHITMPGPPSGYIAGYAVSG
jgi:hypothetical protein